MNDAVSGTVRDLTFRPAVETDLARLRDIDARAFRTDEQYEDDVYATFVSGPQLRNVLACIGGNCIVGYAILDVAERCVRLRSIAVDPAYRRRGYGSALLSESIEQAGRDLELFVERDNAGAIRLYERAGFDLVSSSAELPDRLRMIRKSEPAELSDDGALHRRERG